ncbi:hypothetical protein N7486_002783 [Penicillium sp. IBT 16267x]|nr:hypothetical protein N7486_002783 [Penicillium sp. IBT 16267x]
MSERTIGRLTCSHSSITPLTAIPLNQPTTEDGFEEALLPITGKDLLLDVVKPTESVISPPKTIASDFLAAKITGLEDESIYIAGIKAGLDEANAKGALENDEYRRQLDPFLSKVRSNTSTLRVLKRQRNVLEEDLFDAAATEKRQRQHEPADEGPLERAYKDTITLVMKADGKQRASNFNTARFKADVNAYYDAKHKEYPEIILCHSMAREELAHLFGDQDAVITLPQNGLSLHYKVESLLDKGEIAIVPMPGKMTSPTTWKCVVLNESLNQDIVWHEAEPGEKDRIIRVKDLDGQARPPTLKTLARCVSGCEIPENLIADQTFEGSIDTARDTEAGMILAADVRDYQRRGPDAVGALTTTMKRL